MKIGLTILIMMAMQSAWAQSDEYEIVSDPTDIVCEIDFQLVEERTKKTPPTMTEYRVEAAYQVRTFTNENILRPDENVLTYSSDHKTIGRWSVPKSKKISGSQFDPKLIEQTPAEKRLWSQLEKSREKCLSSRDQASQNRKKVQIDKSNGAISTNNSLVQN